MPKKLVRAAESVYAEAAHLISGDDTAYLQRKIDALGSRGGVVEVPAEDLDLKRPVVVRGTGVILQGRGWPPRRYGSEADTRGSSCITPRVRASATSRS